MKILQVYQIFNPYVASGAAKVAYETSKELARRGHNIVFFASDMKDKFTKGKKGRFIVNNIMVYQFETVYPILAKKFKLYITPKLILVAKNYVKEFDVVHLHGYISFQHLALYPLIRKYRVPYVLQAHGSLSKAGAWRRLKWIYDMFFGYKLLKNASKVIALSKVEAEQYRSMGVPEEKIAIIPNGIDLSEYANLPPRGQFKKKFNISEDKRIVLYLGRIHKIKGIDFLVKAYAYLTKKMNFKDAVLVIAGPDDGYLSEAKSLVQSSEVSSHVLFTGPLYGRDKLEAYVDSNVYVIPSRYDTFPMGLLEAYACEKPVIASNVGGLKELVINGETGLLFEAGNVEQLADKLLYLLNHGEEGKNMGKKAREFVKERYSIEKVIIKLERVYEEVTIGRSSLLLN